MIDKLQKIREEVEKLKSNLIYGACSSQVTMETRCKEEAYNEVLAIINSDKEEPASVWHDASEKSERDDVLIETNDGRIIHRQSINNYGMVKRWAYIDDLLKLDNSCNFGKNLQKEPVSEDLGEYINELSKQFPEVSFVKLSRIAVRVAKWQKNHIWKPADGDNLPEYDREVIALLDNGKVVFAHRPPEYWDGKNIITGKVTRNYPKTYDKGGWNIPDVKYWLDVDLPNQED